MRTADNVKYDTTPTEYLAWASSGLTSEAGEVSGELEKGLRKGDMDTRQEKVWDEMSDVMFYLTALCNFYGRSLEELQLYNMKKLDERNSTTFYKGGEVPHEVK